MQIFRQDGLRVAKCRVDLLLDQTFGSDEICAFEVGAG